MFDEVVEISVRSILISGSATLLASLFGLPLAYLAVVKAKVRSFVPIAESLSGVPTVLIGLLLYMLLSRDGPLGFLNMLYTPQAIIVGQAVLVVPLIIATSFGALRTSYESVGELAITLGATDLQVMLTVLKESLNRVLASLMIAFSRALGELGIALMVGGNIRGETRVFSTSIALSVAVGEFNEAVKLGLILLAVETSLIVCVRMLQGLER